MVRAFVEQFGLEGWSEPAQFCFALGVEWRDFLGKLYGGSPFRMVVYRANMQRLADLATRRGRFNETAIRDDTFAEIYVGGSEVV